MLQGMLVISCWCMVCLKVLCSLVRLVVMLFIVLQLCYGCLQQWVSVLVVLLYQWLGGNCVVLVQMFISDLSLEVIIRWLVLLWFQYSGIMLIGLCVISICCVVWFYSVKVKMLLRWLRNDVGVFWWYSVLIILQFDLVWKVQGWVSLFLSLWWLQILLLMVRVRLLLLDSSGCELLVGLIIVRCLWIRMVLLLMYILFQFGLWWCCCWDSLRLWWCRVGRLLLVCRLKILKIEYMGVVFGNGGIYVMFVFDWLFFLGLCCIWKIKNLY